eukprot:TRINITY_DN43155_c0_g1_i1.p1 TRINITY_DN43155_c0_g1~~TRINITY_DN43155_c0_g1_i1.p1  ORF type:complete len:681 (+),score=74.22 TRINITY_DN43155_c0_g1_i1:158-2200(+)
MAQPSSQRSRAKSIGHYILGKTIGEGTFGKVKLGTHVLTSERVAVKVLEKERILEVADVERVAREVHILKLIRHPHIVQLYEIIETRRQLYLIMEYASGGELFDYIVAKGRVPEPEACRFFHQIIAGLEKVHAMNVVHRDLKPENLLLDEHKNIKIVDFGLSNVYRDGQLLKTACGSPCYAAPEMIAGHSYVPSLCDLWSCGVILFALVCGYLPFEDQNTSALYKKILAADYRAPKFISESSKNLISRLLTTEPAQRYTVPQIRNHAWYRQIQEASTAPCDWMPGQASLEDDVLCDLDAFGFPRDYAIRCLELNKHNHVTTTYHLLAEKKRRMLENLDRSMPGRTVDPHAAFDAIGDSASVSNTAACSSGGVMHQTVVPRSPREQSPACTPRGPPSGAKRAPAVSPGRQHSPRPGSGSVVTPAAFATAQTSRSRQAASPSPPGQRAQTPPARSVDITPRRRASPAPGGSSSGSCVAATASVPSRAVATPRERDLSLRTTPAENVQASTGVTGAVTVGGQTRPNTSGSIVQRTAAREGSPTSAAVKRQQASAATTAGSGISMSARSGISSSPTSSRTPVTARDLTRPTENARRRMAGSGSVLSEAPHSARARLVGRPQAAPVSPRGIQAPLSARGERQPNRATSASPTQISPVRDGASGRMSPPLQAWQGWTPGTRGMRQR